MILSVRTTSLYIRMRRSGLSGLVGDGRRMYHMCGRRIMCVVVGCISTGHTHETVAACRLHFAILYSHTDNVGSRLIEPSDI